MESAPPAFGQAREQLLALVQDIRPQLHRYCARLTGSVVDGEDIVQDTLARALYALSLAHEMPPLRPWLFRIAHNAALDYLKSHGKRFTDPRDDLDDVVGDEPADPSIVRAALSRFVALPIAQRSAVILKDVLGHSLDEVAETMSTSVPAVKAALARGRRSLRAEADAEVARFDPAHRGELERYAALFNLRDWDGVRALVGEDCRLDLVAKSQRRGKPVGDYFARYAREDVRLAVARLEGQLVLAAFVAGAIDPTYFILCDWADGRVQSIRDFRYVTYVADDADYALI